MSSRLHSFAVINHPHTSARVDPSAAIELADTDRGFLPNRLSTAQRDAISNPPEGLTIYNTDTQHLETFDGSSWERQDDDALLAANNLSDLTDTAAARSSLSLGSAATHAATDFDATGTAAALIPQRNLLINASMEIDQVHEGTSAYANTTNYVTDQWFLTGNPGTATGITAQRSTDAPNGFAFSELMTIGTGGTVSAGSLLLFCQRLSGDQTGNLAFGTVGAQSISVSFWMQSNQTGMIPFHMRHNYSGGSSTYLVPFNYTVANTWTYMSATFSGDPAHGTTVDAANDITIGFGLTSGANDMDTPNQWNTNTHHTITGMWQLASITGATLQITGVKVEASSVPTPFVRRDSYSELIGCQRYYEKSYDAGVAPGASSSLNGSEAAYIAGTNGLMRIRSKVSADKDGTWTIYSPVTGTSAKVADITGAVDVSATVSNGGMNGATVTFTATDGHQYALHWTHNAQL